MRTIVFVALLAFVAWSQAAIIPDMPMPAVMDGPSIWSMLPKQLQDNLPDGAKKCMSSMTLKDMLVVRNIMQQLPKFTSCEEILEVLKKNAPNVAVHIQAKSAKMMAMFAIKRAQLKPATMDAVHKAGKMTKSFVKSMVEFVQEQPKEVKDNLDTTFPKASMFLNCDLFKKLIAHIMSKP